MNRTLVESGIDWIGKIPETWAIQPLGLYLKERNQKVSDIDYEPLSVTKNGIVPQLENAAKSDAHDARKKVCKNDFVINSRSDRKQSCGLSNLDGSVSLINIVLQINKYVPNYVKYMLDNTMFAEEFYRNGHGIVADLWTTKYSEMKNIYIPEPSKEEQTNIADYLDEKCSKIDQTIEDNNKAIELLEEYKKSKLNDVVALGLNNEVKFKKTGIQYFKKIPSHWQVKKLKYIIDSFSKGNGITKEEVFADGDIQCIRYGEIYSKYNNSFVESVSRTYVDKINSPKHIFKGDILCAATGELVEEIGKNIVYLGNEPCIAGGDIIIIKHSQEPRYLNYLLNSSLSQEQKSEGKAKLKVVHIYASEMSNIRLPLPPIDEQKEIANYLDKMCSNVDEVIECRKKIIEKLEEYKKSLIYEVVTGKKEV